MRVIFVLLLAVACCLCLLPARASLLLDNIKIGHSAMTNSVITVGSGIGSVMVISSSFRGSLQGDVNGDWKVNALDITMLERMIVGLNQAENADVNGDGEIDDLDITSLERVICGFCY